MNQLTAIHENMTQQKGRLMRLASLTTLLAVTFLILLKLWAWYQTDSVTMLSSLVDSAMDLLASAANFLAIRYALQPPDKEHRFGHGKAEYIAGLLQAAFITVTAFAVMIAAIGRFMHPVTVKEGALGIGVMVISMAVTLGIVLFQRYAHRKTASSSVYADSTHYVSDLLANALVILSLWLATAGDWQIADPIFALLISGYILRGAWKVGNHAFQNLMDREFEDDERERVVSAIKSHPQVKGLHELKTRRSGIHAFIQFHVDVDATLSFPAAHQVAEDLELALHGLFPEAEVLVHTDPV